MSTKASIEVAYAFLRTTVRVVLICLILSQRADELGQVDEPAARQMLDEGEQEPREARALTFDGPRERIEERLGLAGGGRGPKTLHEACDELIRGLTRLPERLCIALQNVPQVRRVFVVDDPDRERAAGRVAGAGRRGLSVPTDRRERGRRVSVACRAPRLSAGRLCRSAGGSGGSGRGELEPPSGPGGPTSGGLLPGS